ncbi:hypothetical protein Tco_0945206, partial [Tanacetum coccineum]
DEVFPPEEKPLLAAASPTTDSLGYVSESDFEEEPEEDPADYPANEGDDGDDKDESSDDDEDDDVDIEGDKEEEEHPALADSTTITLPTVEHAPSAEETEPFETDESAATPPPHPAYRVTSRMLIRDEPPTPFWSEAEIARLLAIPSPPPSPLSPCLTYPLGYRAVMIRLRVEAPSTSHKLPLPSPIVLLRTRASVAIYKVGKSSSAPTARPDGDFMRDYGFIATMHDEIMQDPERDVGYGNTDTWDEMLMGMPGAPATDETKLGRWTERQMVTSRVNMLFRDRHAHARTTKLIEIETRMSREAWGRSMDASNLACTEVMTLRTQVVTQQSEIIELRAADHRR